MTARYIRPPAATRDQVAALIGIVRTRRALAELVHVAESTVDQWVAAPGAARSSAMPAGLYELAQIKIERLGLV